MDAPLSAVHYFQEIDTFLGTYKQKIEDEKKEIAECQKKFSSLVNTFSQETSSNSIINSLFKDEPEGIVFSQCEERRKQLAEQRRAEYNAYLEKKEAERLSKKRIYPEKEKISPKSLLDTVDYNKILAKRKEEEARFRDMNNANVAHHFQPTLNEETREPDLNTPNSSNVSPRSRSNSTSVHSVNVSKAVSLSSDVNAKHPELEKKKRVADLDDEYMKLLEKNIAKQLEEQKHQMLLQFTNELQKNNIIKEEMQSLKSPSSSVKSSPQRRITRNEDFPYFGRTGGGGDPLRDPHGNLLAMRGQRRMNSADYSSILSFPSMQQQPVKDKMTLYKEELQRQIEEKKRLEDLERAKIREQEEKIAQRIEEQRLKMLEEYENELKKMNKAKEGFQRQQERAKNLEEFKKNDAEARRRRLPEVKSPTYEPGPVVQERSNSPPIPAVRTKVLLERAVGAVPEVVKPENTFSRLAEIRRKIMEEQQKPQNNLKKSYEIMNRRTVQEISDDDDDDDDILKASTNS